MVNGEMGNSLWHHPAQYLALIRKYRTSLSAGRKPGTTRVGVALHWNKVCGNCFYVPHVDSQQQYNSTYTDLFKQQKDQLMAAFDVAGVRRVLEAADALGISHYAPAPMRGVSPGMFAMPIDTAVYEMSLWGINFKVGLRAGGLGGCLGGWVGD
jgi:hypothetical protein